MAHQMTCHNYWQQQASNELTERAALVNASSVIFAPIFSMMCFMSCVFVMEVTRNVLTYFTPGVDVTIPHNNYGELDGVIRQLQLTLANAVLQGHTCVAVPLKSVA